MVDNKGILMEDYDDVDWDSPAAGKHPDEDEVGDWDYEGWEDHPGDPNYYGDQ